MQADIKGQLADLAGHRTIEYSGSWTDEDLAEATAAALRRFEDEVRKELLNPAS